MSRDPDLYLADILEAIRRVKELSAGMTRTQFEADWKTVDATLRNLEILGEAVKRLPAGHTNRYPEVPWKNIAGFRDVLAHAYFGVDEDIVWDVITRKLGPLESAVRDLLGPTA